MRIGRTDSYRCDFCAEIIRGEPDELKQGGVVNHFCQETRCLADYLVEKAFAKDIADRSELLAQDRVRNIIDEKVDEEFTKRWSHEHNLLSKKACPSCKERFRQLKV